MLTCRLSQGNPNEDLCSDKKIVMQAVSNHGMVLEFASEALRMDPEIVTAAVAQDGAALQWCTSKQQRNTKELVLKAVSKSWKASDTMGCLNVILRKPFLSLAAQPFISIIFRQFALFSVDLKH